ncbi:YibE/F family protein [bacterium]|nr:YibE/F family protein [bacterium]
MKKIIIVIFLFLFTPFFVDAQDIDNTKEDVIFKARVIQVLEEREVDGEGDIILQQKLELTGLEGEFKNKKIFFNGIGDLLVKANKNYNEGDEVLVLAVYDHENNVSYYITDYVRTNALLILFVLFVILLLVVSRIKGLRSLLSLVITFCVIIYYIIPKIISGSNPLFVAILGSIMIIFAVIYITEGFNEKAHIAVFSIFVSLVSVLFLSQIFVGLAHLTGISGEDVLPLISLGNNVVNFKGLLLAGILIGTLGVLDDVVVSQIATVKEIIDTDPYQHAGEVFRKSYRVGVSHISSMVNTLFLAYAGVSFPLLILFISGGSAFPSWWHIVNNEVVAAEIVRTLAGSIGIIMSVPLSTALAVWWYKFRNTNK